MAVEITVNWNFIGEGDNAQVAYATGQPPPEQGGQDHAELEDLPFLGSVLPLSSSVLAPGLSMPVPAR